LLLDQHVLDPLHYHSLAPLQSLDEKQHGSLVVREHGGGLSSVLSAVRLLFGL
jgi:hypothetical protein